MFCTGAAEAEVVLNELLPDPEGADAGFEWVELFNAGGGEVALGGWVIAAGTSTYATSDPIADTVLAPGAWLVVEVVGISLGNAGTSADSVQLRDCHDTAVDTIAYGTPNTDGWLDDAGGEAEVLAPAPTMGHTLGRMPDGGDTDRGDDIVDLATPTPGGSNVAAGCEATETGIVINELVPDPEGADAGAEWVELVHVGAEVVDLGGWVLEAGTSEPAPVHTFTELLLWPGDRLVVGGAPSGIAAPELSLGNATSSSDVVRLVDCGGAVVDTVVYGEPNSDGFADDVEAPAMAIAQATETGSALHRVPDGHDTNDNATDFVVTRTPTPGAPNVTPEVPERTVAASEGC